MSDEAEPGSATREPTKPHPDGAETAPDSSPDESHAGNDSGAAGSPGSHSADRDQQRHPGQGDRAVLDDRGWAQLQQPRTEAAHSPLGDRIPPWFPRALIYTALSCWRNKRLTTKSTRNEVASRMADSVSATLNSNSSPM